MSSIDTAMGSRGHKRRRFISPFSTLTLFGFLLLLTSCGQNGTGSESSTSSVVEADNRTTFLPEPGGGIRKDDVVALLQTRDGGRTWREIAHSAA